MDMVPPQFMVVECQYNISFSRFKRFLFASLPETREDQASHRRQIMKHPIRDRIRIFNKHILNPLTRRLARSSLGVFANVRHVGRRSGKHYETPILVRPADGGFVIALTYGPEVDW